MLTSILVEWNLKDSQSSDFSVTISEQTTNHECLYISCKARVVFVFVGGLAGSLTGNIIQQTYILNGLRL